MPRCIAKLAQDKYVEWSTVVDAPVSWVMTRDEMLQFLDVEHGRASYAENRERLDRADKFGTSFHTPMSVDDLIRCNRAGKNERTITLASIIKRYDRKNEGKV